MHAAAVNHCRGAKFMLVHGKKDTRFILEVRAFDDGVACRHIVPGNGARTPDAAIEFKIPAGSTVWHHDLRGHYEGVHTEQVAESIEADTWIAPPMTFKLPGNAGYGAITEAALVNYAGMASRPAGIALCGSGLGTRNHSVIRLGFALTKKRASDYRTPR